MDHGALLTPVDEEDEAYERTVNGFLVHEWLNASPACRTALDRVIRNLGGVQAGTEGEVVPFNGAWQHTTDELDPGDPAVIVQPGWRIERRSKRYLLSKAIVRAATERMERAMRFSDGVLVLTEESVLGKLSRAVTKMVPFIGNKKAAKGFIQGEVLPAVGDMLKGAFRFKKAVEGQELSTPEGGMAEIPKRLTDALWKDAKPAKLKKAIEQFFAQYAEHAKFEDQPFPMEAEIAKAWRTLNGAIVLLWRYSNKLDSGESLPPDRIPKATQEIINQARTLGAVFRQVAEAL